MEIEDGGMAEEAADWFSRSFQLQIFGKKIDATGAKRLLGLESQGLSICIAFATLAQPTCSKTEPIFVTSSSSWVIAVLPQPRCIRGSKTRT